MKKDHGGQAFPSESMYTSEAGMTLRDYFAAKAMQAWISTYGVTDRHPATNSTCDTVAEQAYQVADAMLKARKAGGEE
ncbi:TPA: hypothetical protein L4G69_002828 [Pseudomonas aeruginosa]|nr:hypothetical protein [Pseudomonas aeruginosa]HBO3198728.1 hypothetical protein [Pseudomonas aeruginosa]